MRVSLLQFAASLDVAENLEAIRGLAAEAAAAASGWDAPHVLVLPEAAMHDFGPPDLPLGGVAQPLDGPVVAALGEIARRTRAVVVAGMFEVSAVPARPFNTVVVLGDGGDLVASYRKAHLFDAFGYRESDRLSAGNGSPVVVPVADLTIGLLTCYDLRFPEQAVGLLRAGADTLVVPAAWVAGPHKADHWSSLLRARAIESTAYVAAAAQCGPRYVGHSMVIDPMGVVVADGGDGPGVVAADLSRAVVDEVRRTNPSLANRRDLPGVVV